MERTRRGYETERMPHEEVALPEPREAETTGADVAVALIKYAALVTITLIGAYLVLHILPVVQAALR